MSVEVLEEINRLVRGRLLLKRLEGSTSSVECRGSEPEEPWMGFPGQQQPSLPVYNGSEDPFLWLMKAETLFYFFDVPEEAQVPYASLHLDGEAIHWLVCDRKLQRLSSWKDFKEKILARFSVDGYDGPAARLHRLKQTGSVREYYSAFEALMARIPDRKEEVLLVEMFVAGLEEGLKINVLALDPKSMDAAFKLARMYEHMAAQPPGTGSGSGGELPVSLKKLTPLEVMERMKKNLCYNCDESFFEGHRQARMARLSDLCRGRRRRAAAAAMKGLLVMRRASCSIHAALSSVCMFPLAAAIMSCDLIFAVELQYQTLMDLLKYVYCVY